VRVLHLIDHLGLGGAQRMLVDLMEARGPDIDASVYSLRARAFPHLVSRLSACGVRYGTLALSKRNPLGFGALLAVLRRERPDLLHAHLEYSTTFGCAAALMLGADRPVIVAYILNDPARRQAMLHRMGGWVLAPRIDAHVAISATIAEAIGVAYGGRARRVEVVPPGIDLSWFADGALDRGRVAELRGDATRVVGTVGRLAAQKAIHVLLDATPRLLTDDPGTRVLIVGDGPLRDELERHARRLGVAHAVSFAGYLADVRPAYRAMDVFVLPSRDEGFGIVFQEAMAMGVPVIGTRVIGSVDAVEHEVTGLLVEYGDAAALAESILRVLGDAALASRLRIRAAQHAREGFSREQVASNMESLYRDLHRARRAAGGNPRGIERQ
jgi:glycosyltransferase involved in cell wall biosynthesis